MRGPTLLARRAERLEGYGRFERLAEEVPEPDAKADPCDCLCAKKAAQAAKSVKATVFCEAKVANVPASDPIELPPTSVSRVNSPQGIQMKTNSRPYRAR